MRGGQRLLDPPDELLRVLVEQRQIQLQLAGEVLVERSAMSAIAAAW